MTETLSRGPSTESDFGDRLAELMRNAGTEDSVEAVEPGVSNDDAELGFDDSSDIPTTESSEGVVLSPTAEAIRRGADRVATLLENRAANKQATSAQNEAYDSYSENITATKSRERSERIERGKAALRKIGSSALARLKNAGLVTLGLGLMAGEATGRGLKNGAKAGYEATKQGVASFNEKVGDGMMAAGKKIEQGMDTVGGKIDSTKETVADYRNARKQAAERKAEAAATKKYERHAAKMSAKNEKINAKRERIEAAKERARQAKAAAEARKQARRAKWAARKEAVVSGATKAAETVKFNAEVAASLAAHMTREQKQKLGHLATRAKAAGEAAVETWKNYPER